MWPTVVMYSKTVQNLNPNETRRLLLPDKMSDPRDGRGKTNVKLPVIN